MNNFKSIKRFFKKNNLIRSVYINGQIFVRRKSIKKRGLFVLKLINNTFDNLKITYFADFGTLLGFIRENNFISYDLDIDLGILHANESSKKLIKKKLSNLGFKLLFESLYKDLIIEQGYMFKGVRVDLFFYTHDNKHSYVYVGYRNDKIKYPLYDDCTISKLTYNKIQNIEEKIFKGVKLNIPQNPENILTEKYGSGWRIPDKNWTFDHSPTVSELTVYGKFIKYD